MKSVEDFTEFDQRAAYFDGDPVIATKQGVNVLEPGSQVHFMAEIQALLDFPPAPQLGLDGKVNPKRATASEKRGQDLFFGKAACAGCHQAPYYTVQFHAQPEGGALLQAADDQWSHAKR